MARVHLPLDQAAEQDIDVGGGDMPARRVLLTVSGLSPQVITETIYGLAVAPEPGLRFVPTEVHVLSTAEGARRVRLALLSEQPGGFRRLVADYRLPTIRFDDTTVHVVRNADGHELDDIRDEDDNARMADAITDLVRDLTSDPTCTLHVSLAGGRKTMGYYAGYALSLFGREQDRLSHVLVSSPFESHPDFYYPTPQSQVISLPGGGWADANKAKVSLALIPFVRLRHGLPQALLDGRSTFARTVEVASAQLQPPSLTLDVSSSTITVDGRSIALTPFQFSLMAALAQRAKRGLPAIAAPFRDAHDPEWATEVLRDLRDAVGVMNVASRVEDTLRRDCSGATVSPHFSKLRARLAAALAPGRLSSYFDDGPTHRHRRYRVPLEPGTIHFVPPASASLPSD